MWCGSGSVVRGSGSGCGEWDWCGGVDAGSVVRGAGSVRSEFGLGSEWGVRGVGAGSVVRGVWSVVA